MCVLVDYTNAVLSDYYNDKSANCNNLVHNVFKGLSFQGIGEQGIQYTGKQSLQFTRVQSLQDTGEQYL